jgi:FAD:protein FMN transferase
VTTTLTELRFAAMGTEVLIACHGPRAAVLAELGRSEIEALERRWTRFDPASELSALNDAAGTGPLQLSPPTFELVQSAIEAWRFTAGYFDPTVGAAMVAAGYDRTYVLGPAVRPQLGGEPTPGPAGIAVDETTRTVSLPDGVALDLGGIGKGRAADLVSARLLDAGADGVCVDLGGDLAVAGQPPDGQAWIIGVDDWGDLGVDHVGGDDAPTLALARGGVATSATTARRWTADGEAAHHLIDPATGRPSTSTVRSATVLAGQAMWAEVVAKAALLAGPTIGRDLLASSGACGFLVDDTGAHLAAGDLGAYLA